MNVYEYYTHKINIIAKDNIGFIGNIDLENPI